MYLFVLVYLFFFFFSAWENAINTNHDPFELWFNYISWYEQNRQNDVENKFRSTLERCLSQYEHDESHKQDIRMVKLWMKYVSIHLFRILVNHLYFIQF